jgi:class 3 adenylate cyclase
VQVSQGHPPSGIVTFLFTDIEGSTRRWEADADGMRAALLAHDDVLRTGIEAQGGFLFKHTGDGVCAAFASPRSAVDAAVAAQRALELPVRMGLATGEAELRGADYFGAVLNRAARVMAAGHGGQILLAESAAVLLSGVDLVDLGPRRLRDLSTAVGLFQVRAAGLRSDFPPLRALDASPGNLRPAVTSFIGRESEVAEVQAATKAHRLVTLTGVGGVGKTRLALEVAARSADEFPDGTWFFDLAAVVDPAAVPDAVAAVLGIIQQPGKSVAHSVAAALEGRVRLLVFDNCEHVLDSVADLVEAIQAASATVTILATSREGLGVSEEHLWRVPSLDVNSGTESAAVNLFVDRAHSVVSDFSLTQPGEADAVVEICRRLDGIPAVPCSHRWRRAFRRKLARGRAVLVTRHIPSCRIHLQPVSCNFYRWASGRIHRRCHLVVGGVKNTRRNLPIWISSWRASTAESTGSRLMYVPLRLPASIMRNSPFSRRNSAWRRLTVMSSRRMSLSGWRPADVKSRSSRNRAPALGPRLTISRAEPLGRSSSPDTAPSSLGGVGWCGPARSSGGKAAVVSTLV